VPGPSLPRRLAQILLVAGLLAAPAASCREGASPSPLSSPTAFATPAETAAGPTPGTTPPAGPPRSAVPGASPTGEPSPTAAARGSPGPTPAAGETPATPTARAFWTAAARGIAAAGRLAVTVEGPNPGELRFEARASATIVDGAPGFVCVGGRAYDGQSAWTEVRGDWTCGADAFAAGFRNLGQPIDAWSDSVPRDDAIRETVRVTADGRWRWDYRGTSAYFGGRVTASALLDPATGRIVQASRTDPTGDTTYHLRYGASFPPIAVPR